MNPDKLPAFLLDRLPDSKTLVEILEQAGHTVQLEEGWYKWAGSESGLYYFLPADPTVETEYVLFDHIMEAEQKGLLRIIRPDAHGWYKVEEGLPDPKGQFVIVRLDEKDEEAVGEFSCYRIAYFVGKRRVRHLWVKAGFYNSNIDPFLITDTFTPYNNVTHWQFPKPPIEATP